MKNNLTMQVPTQLPLLPVRDIVVFPYMILPLYIRREMSIKAVEESLARNRFIFLSSQKEASLENPPYDSMYKTGVVAMIMRMRRLSDGRVKVLVQGVAKAKMTECVKAQPCFEVKIAQVEEAALKASQVEQEALMRTARRRVSQVISVGRMVSPDVLTILDDVKEPGRLADLIASSLNFQIPEAQKVLECSTPCKRLAMVNKMLASELEVVQVQNKIKNSAKDEMAKTQREYFLREQMRAIKNELGDGDVKGEGADELRDKIRNMGMPADVQKEAMKQLNRLERMHPDSSESSMVRTYLDTLVELPWNASTQDKIDIHEAQKILDEEHHDLNKVKERIIEFLAVRALKGKNLKGPILCFAGPPGVGKTSLGKSIARALGRKYFRLSLGGMKEEAEIRGHRRTYVGAMPGKIVQALKTARSNNPVIVLDEIDKLGSDFRGDPSSAMLEVLDPEQNSSFRDNYLNVDFDLSKVLFIATANRTDNIPLVLRDRMEVINISGYTENDKLEIAKRYIVRKQIDANGLNPRHLEFTDDGLKTLISHYTREAGVRSLNREIGAVCRKVAKRVVGGDDSKFVVDSDRLRDLMGPDKFLKDDKYDGPQIGIATGLAWTPVGGDILYVESLSFKGKGQLKLTGQLGDVMKESAEAALSYAKARHEDWGISSQWFEKKDVHIHLPAGAIPKDGPSAGVTLVTSLLSLMMQRPVRMDVAMTGEVTLGGRVLPVGGIREKALAALNHGIQYVVLPTANKKDLQEIPEAIRSQLKFIFVENIDEVLKQALVPSKAKSRKTRPNDYKAPVAA